MAKVNRHRLAEYLGELRRKEDTNNRYVAALRGETLTRNPHLDLEMIMLYITLVKFQFSAWELGYQS
ncbi:hypothetical protein CFP56_000195 [Quercus suber]|uniref:Uncharacterized protein n=1 Tax=Quercus suber TaxID=58331 RepID=A0AAW0MJ50_QUESU